jgi:hypothetical protein
MKLLIVQSSSASCHFLPLRSKYFPQHPVLEHPQSIFSPYCETTTTTTTTTTTVIIITTTTTTRNARHDWATECNITLEEYHISPKYSKSATLKNS